jgi:hypothetical protein
MIILYNICIMINEKTFIIKKGMDGCSKYLSEYGWVTKCESGGGWAYEGWINNAVFEKLAENPLFGPFTILAFSILAIIGILLLIWTIAIKGYALWTAAQRKEKWWFIALLIINTVGILEVVYLIFVAKKWRFGRKEREGDKVGDSGGSARSESGVVHEHDHAHKGGHEHSHERSNDIEKKGE